MAIGGLAPSLGWLVFASGGRDAGALVVAEAAAFVAIVVLAFAGGLRRPVGPGGWVVTAVVAAAAGAGVATAFSSSISTSVPVLVEWLWLAALAELVVVAVPDPGAVRVLVVALTVALAGQIAWGFLIWFARGDPGVWHLGTFYSPNAYAGYVLLLGFPVVAVALGSASRWRAVGAGGVAVLVLLAVVLSASRTAVGIAVVGLVVTGWLSVRGRGVVGVVWRSLALVVATVVIGMVLTSSLFFPRGGHGIAGGLNRKAASQGTSIAARQDTWVGALRQAKAHPVVGTGPGTFGDVLFRDQPVSDWWSAYAHNQFLEQLSDGGILLGVAFAAIPVTALAAGWRGLRRARSSMSVGLVVGLGATALHMANDIDWSFPALAAAFVTVAVLAASPFGHREAGIPASRCPNVAVLAVAVAGLVVLAGGALSHRVREATPATVAAVRERGSWAARLAPWSSAPPRWQADHLARLGDERGAVASLVEARRRDPFDLRLLWAQGRLEVSLGRRNDARRTFEAAIALGRRSPAGYVLGAENEVADGRPGRAAALLDEGLAVAAQQPDPAIRSATVEYLQQARARLVATSTA